jgi:hypothetical protein
MGCNRRKKQKRCAKGVSIAGTLSRIENPGRLLFAGNGRREE